MVKVKVFLFLLLIIGIMIYPLFNTNYKIIKNEKSNELLAGVIFKNANFYIYNNDKLEKKGNFETLKVYKNKYVVYNLKALNIIKNEKYELYEAIFQNDIITGYKVTYANPDLTINTQKAVYDKNTRILNGGKFKLFAKDFRGYGESFQVDDKKDLYAQNIKYFLKVEK